MKKLLIALTLLLSLTLAACDGDNGADIDEEQFENTLAYLQERVMAMDGYEGKMEQPVAAQGGEEAEASAMEASIISEGGEDGRYFSEETIDGDTAHEAYYDAEEDLTYAYFSSENTDQDEETREYYEGFMVQGDFNQMFLMQASQIQGLLGNEETPQEEMDHTITDYENTFDGEGDFSMTMTVEVEEMGEVFFELSETDGELLFEQSQDEQTVTMTLNDYDDFFDTWEGIDKDDYEEGDEPEEELPEDDLE